MCPRIMSELRTPSITHPDYSNFSQDSVIKTDCNLCNSTVLSAKSFCDPSSLQLLSTVEDQEPPMANPNAIVVETAQSPINWKTNIDNRLSPHNLVFCRSIATQVKPVGGTRTENSHCDFQQKYCSIGEAYLNTGF